MNNPNNKLITKEKVQDILNYFGPIGNNNEPLTINNLDFYQKAFVHESYYQSQQNASYHKECYIDYVALESNERLEYLGDHILKSSLSRYLYKRFSTEREGFLTKLKIKIEKCSMLHQFAVILGFKEYLLLSLQVDNMSILDIDRGRSTPSYYEDAFESFLGALMEDFDEQGYIYAERFICNIIENTIDFSELISKNDNFKDSLQQFFQCNQWKTPVYKNLDEQGPLYRKIFTRYLVITFEQFNSLNNLQQIKIKEYTEDCLEFYKTNDKQIFQNLFIIVKTNYILCLGIAKKVVAAEQKAAEIALNNLYLDNNYSNLN